MKTKKLTPLQRQKIYELKTMPAEEYEKICKQCGVCCLCKMDLRPLETNTMFLRVHCAHLDVKTKRCNIYANRFRLAPDCCKVDMNIILHSDLIPDSCGYREYIFGPAKNPAIVDLENTCPENQVDFDNPYEILSRIINESKNWTQR